MEGNPINLVKNFPTEFKMILPNTSRYWHDRKPWCNKNTHPQSIPISSTPPTLQFIQYWIMISTKLEKLEIKQGSFNTCFPSFGKGVDCSRYAVVPDKDIYFFFFLSMIKIYIRSHKWQGLKNSYWSFII